MEYLAARSQGNPGLNDSRLNNRQQAKLIWQGSHSAQLIYCSPRVAKNSTAEAIPEMDESKAEGRAQGSSMGGHLWAPQGVSSPDRVSWFTKELCHGLTFAHYHVALRCMLLADTGFTLLYSSWEFPVKYWCVLTSLSSTSPWTHSFMCGRRVSRTQYYFPEP